MPRWKTLRFKTKAEAVKKHKQVQAKGYRATPILYHRPSARARQEGNKPHYHFSKTTKKSIRK